jgi:hypothetical protein
VKLTRSWIYPACRDLDRTRRDRARKQRIAAVPSARRKLFSYLRFMARVGVCAAAAFLAMPGATRAQGGDAQTPNPAVPPRIAAGIEDAVRTRLAGNVHPQARAQNDQGIENPNTSLGRITMMFKMTAEQQTDLGALLAQQQDATSPNFHRWLTPEEYGARFGIAESDLDAISAWLAAKGLQVVETSRSRSWVAFTGTASQVQDAFETEIHRYRKNGKSFFANAAEPTVPSAFAGMVLGFRGLNNYPVSAPAIVFQRARTQPAATPQPDFTVTTGLAISHNLIAPDDFQTIYDLKPLYSAGINGTGQTIAVVGQTDVVESDIDKFRSLSGLPSSPVQMTLVPGSADPGILDGDVVEASLDLEWSGATAPHATILFVYSTNVFGSLEYAIDQRVAPVVSISYGQCEENTYPTFIAQLAQIAQMANAEGITIVSAAGDGGPLECDYETQVSPAIEGLTVQLPASLPYVTGVGGTMFSEGNGSYWSSSNNSAGGSALSYIPEIAWVETVQSGNFTFMVGGGGGASHVFAKPTWQSAPGVPNDGARDVPDISLSAAVRHDPYLICTEVQASSGSGFTPSCVNGFEFSNSDYTTVGGTSAGAPSFAGIVALINQKAGPQGNLNYSLYPVARNTPNAIHDIIGGGTFWECAENCPNGAGNLPGPGYDLATGLGSIDAFNLVSAWPTAAVPTGTTPLLFSISPSATTAGSPNFVLTATGSGFTNNTQILWNSSSVGVTMLPGGTATTVSATISAANVAYGTLANVSVANVSQTGGGSGALTFTVTGNPPANDNFAQAIPLVSPATSTSIVDNSAATTETTDPTPTCAPNSLNPRTKTVWWSYTASASGTVTFDTIGSPYDTILSIWTGSKGNLSMVGCNDDIAPGFHQSQVVQFVRAGTTYYLMVSAFGPPDAAYSQYGGKTVLNAYFLQSTTTIAVTPTTLKVNPGQTATFQVNNAESQAVNLSCTISLNSLTTCSVSNVAANASTTMTIATIAASSQVASKRPSGGWPAGRWSALWFAAIVFFILASSFAWQRNVAGLRWTGTLLLVVSMALCLTECGGGKAASTSQGTVASSGTPPGNYEVVLTATPTAGGSPTTVFVILEVE